MKEASDSDTIDKTADELLSYDDEKLLVCGYAYKTESIEKDQSKGFN